jgi:integrase
MSLILPRPAVELLKRRPQADSPFVFPPNGPSLRYGWEHVREAAGLLDVRCHDLRRTVGAWLATSGATELIIAKALGHRSTRSTTVYARLTDEVVRRNVEETSAALLTGAIKVAAPKRKRRKAG